MTSCIVNMTRTIANRQIATKSKANKPAITSLSGPIHDQGYVEASWLRLGGKGKPEELWSTNPKAVVSNYMIAVGEKPVYKSVRAKVESTEGFRSSVIVDSAPPPLPHFHGHPSLPPPKPEPIVGIGDALKAKDAEKLAASHACVQLGVRGLLSKDHLAQRRKTLKPADNAESSNSLRDAGDTSLTLEMAREFMDYYCNRFDFSKPELVYSHSEKSIKEESKKKWTVSLYVDGHRIGIARSSKKATAARDAYLDAVEYLKGCDHSLWITWQSRKSTKGAASAHVTFIVNADTDEELGEILHRSRQSLLYQRARAMKDYAAERITKTDQDVYRNNNHKQRAGPRENVRVASVLSGEDPNGRFEATLLAKSAELRKRLASYQADLSAAALRIQRKSLPISTHASSILAKISTSAVVVVLAATGSGKTTQIPQLILDDWVLRGDGSRCNIICTQPRRIAAISVAERVARERNEIVGDSVGYQVRFESKRPKPNGSICFCTTGLLLRILQSKSGDGEDSSKMLDTITHIIVDEVHERDVDTDVLLYVLRKLCIGRRSQNKSEVKIILMSATIDPKLFTNYFADPITHRLAPVVEVPGRSFPVQKCFLDETVEILKELRLPNALGGWVWQEKSVANYLARELAPMTSIELKEKFDTLDMPFALIALIIAWVSDKSAEGHILVFLPGWDEIQAVKGMLEDRRRYPLLNIDFSSTEFEIHILHSNIPMADQQVVFSPASPNVRRIVLSTNIAETSVTIPDVVYVIDSAKCREKWYDPERRLSQLVSAWTGTSNILQRAGRAGRHRPGEYYGIVSNARFASMDTHQTVEMLRTDLSNTCMHITGLDLPGLSVEDVLTSTIQPPEPARIHAAIKSLLMLGAIDKEERLTSLGKVLLQLPIDAAIGKLCLLGSFFRCLDTAVTLAAILTIRDPFLSPPLLKQEADRVKCLWAPVGFQSDIFAILAAFQSWGMLQKTGNYTAEHAFVHDNFLSRPTLVLIQRTKEHLLSSLDKAGALQISGGGFGSGPSFHRHRQDQIEHSLNMNGESLPLLSALIATAAAPNFAIRISQKKFRTCDDLSVTIHPSSVNSSKNEKASDAPIMESKQLFAFGEKSRTGAIGQSGGQTFLRTTTRLDPLGYMLFGASKVRVTGDGLECDDWLPIVGQVSTLDDVERLKEVLDLCLLRAFEGLSSRSLKRTSANERRSYTPKVTDGDSEWADGEDVKPDLCLSAVEIKDLDLLASSVTGLLNQYAESRGDSISQIPSRSATPLSVKKFPRGFVAPPSKVDRGFY